MVPTVLGTSKYKLTSIIFQTMPDTVYNVHPPSGPVVQGQLHTALVLVTHSSRSSMRCPSPGPRSTPASLPVQNLTQFRLKLFIRKDGDSELVIKENVDSFPRL
jgi:hypothetical protein